MSAPRLTLIAAVARNGVIGGRNALLWRLSSDLKRFRALTMGKPIIVGRKTFDSFPGPLPGRTLIVVTRDAGWSMPGVTAARSVEAALAAAEALGAAEIMVAGGGEIYAATIGRADALAITEVALAPEGDAFFPAIDAGEWREVRREAGVRGPKDGADFAFVEYERRR